MKFDFKIWIESEEELASALGISDSEYGSSEDERRNKLFDLYHMDSTGELKGMWVWWWDGMQLYAEKGGTHGLHFGHITIGKNYKGRYNPSLKIATIALPYFANKVVTEKELLGSDEKAIPLINALYKRFPKLEKIYGIG